jgi:hypothetical protein
MSPLKYIIVSICISLSASTYLYAKKLEGYYIALSDDQKVKGVFEVPVNFLTGKPDFTRIQRVIKFVGEDNQTVFLEPNKIKQVSFTLKGKEIRMRSVQNNIVNDRMFLELIVDGPVSLFHFQETKYYTRTHYRQGVGSTSGMSTPGTIITGSRKETYERLLLQKNDDELFKIRRFYFTKDLAVFFQDCPAIAERVKNSYLSDLEALVKEYNTKCL